MTERRHNPNYIHHRKEKSGVLLREIVFGLEDGMVSTMGAVTGIATGTGSHTIVVLSGIIIISVESISMAVGSYLSNKSEDEMKKRMLAEEKEEIHDHLNEEEKEMVELFEKDGWSPKLAQEMAAHTAKHPALMLKEMAYRELHIIPDAKDAPIVEGVTMLFSYIVGGLVPLIPYFLFDIGTALVVSISGTLIGLFALGAFTTRFSKRPWWKAGLEMLLLAGAAAAVGYAIGYWGDKYLLNK